MKVATFHTGFMHARGGERVVIEETAALRGKGYGVDVFACLRCRRPGTQYPRTSRALCYAYGGE